MIPNSPMNWRPAAHSTFAWSCRRCCATTASKEELEVCFCHSNHAYKTLGLEKIAPDDKHEKH